MRIVCIVFRTILRFFLFFDKIEQEASLHQQTVHEVSVQWTPNCQVYLNATQKFLPRQYIGAHNKQLPIFVTYSNTWTLSIIATKKGTFFSVAIGSWRQKFFQVCSSCAFPVIRNCSQSSSFASCLQILAIFHFQCYKVIYKATLFCVKASRDSSCRNLPSFFFHVTLLTRTRYCCFLWDSLAFLKKTKKHKKTKIINFSENHDWNQDLPIQNLLPRLFFSWKAIKVGIWGVVTFPIRKLIFFWFSGSSGRINFVFIKDILLGRLRERRFVELSCESWHLLPTIQLASDYWCFCGRNESGKSIPFSCHISLIEKSLHNSEKSRVLDHKREDLP